MEFSLDMNIKLGEKNHKHVAIVSIREPESGEYAEFYGTVSPGGSMGPELTQFVLREIESWISLKQDEQDEARTGKPEVRSSSMVVCGENGKSSKERMPWGRSNTILGSISFCFVGLFPSYAQMLVPILPDGSSAWERDSFSAEKYGGEFLFCQIAAQPCPLPARL